MTIEIQQRHPWPNEINAAIAIQEELRNEVILEDRLPVIEYVAGVDVGYLVADGLTRAAVAVLRFPDLTLVEYAIAYQPTTFPYIPGFLSFREVPAVLESLQKLTITPDLILCDGQGIAHPRQFGIACHIGVLTNLPTIGVAKSRLVGHHDELPLEKGNWQALRYQGKVIGAVLRSRTGTKPLYISSGHRISLPTAIDYVLRCTPKYRLPETTRWADKLASHS